MLLTPTKIGVFCLTVLAGVQPVVAGDTEMSLSAAPKRPPAKPAVNQGTTTVRFFTDDHGRAVRVDILRSAGPTLDAFTRRYVREHWHGPPNSSKTVSFDYRLQ